MKKQLPEMSCLRTPGMYTGLCIFLLMICAAVHSQPTMLARIPNESKNFISVNGHLYYSVNDSLMTLTATSATTLVFKTGEPIIKIYDITAGVSFFFVTQTSSGQRLWRTDGTTANTVQMIAETQIHPLLIYNSQLFLQVKSQAMGIELWKMDASYNVMPLKDINPGPADGFVGDLIIHNDLLYFIADAGTGTDLWRSDATTAGTVLSVDLDDTGVDNPSGFSGLTSFNGEMYFTWDYETGEWGNHRAELWKTNGTSAGTSMVIQYNDGGSYNYLSNFLVFKGKLYFFHNTFDPVYTYLSVTDGTTTGTKHLELAAVDGGPRQLMDAGSYFLFYTEGQGNPNPIKKSDGITTTTVHRWAYEPNMEVESIELVYTEDRAFFLDYTRGSYYGTNTQLWQADLATGVTRTLTEIYNISLDGASNIVANDGSIFFTTYLSGQMRLWYYDPGATPYSCEGTGTIYQEIWPNVAGTDVRTFDFSAQPPGSTRQFSSFETSQYYANNYASRMRGWVCVPQSGDYTFWISSDDQSELYLSTDASEENKQLIAWVYGHTPFRNYNKYPSQKSVQISLQAGRQYYIEARHKEGNGNDFISVGWQLPDGTMQRPISGNNLIPITPGPNEPPSITITSPQPNENFSSPTWVMIEAKVTDPDGVKNVKFDVLYGSTSFTLEFTNPPYQFQWDEVPSGSYQLIVSATDNRNSGTSEIAFFSVDKSACAGTGTIVREIWTGVPGTSVSDVPFYSPPDRTVTLGSLSTSNYYGNDYGSRIRGYVCVTETGAYTFWIAGDDNCELWLSSNDDPDGKSRIAHVPGHTRVNEWTKYSAQQSAPVNLVQGQRYYIEVLHKEGNGADHVEVGWQLPSGTFERPITGNRLIPFDDPSTSAARFAADEIINFGEEESTFAVSPNPAASGQQVSIKLPGATDSDVQVDIKSITGISVQNETLSSSGEAVTIDLNPSIAAGMYLIRVSNNKKRWATRLQVK